VLRKILKIAKTILKCPSLNLQTAAAACIGKIKAGGFLLWPLTPILISPPPVMDIPAARPSLADMLLLGA